MDICATAEEVAMRPVNDLIAVLEDTKNNAKLKNYFYWNKEHVQVLKTKAMSKAAPTTPNPKTVCSSMVVFNEVHQYENYKNIKVFISSLGKKKPRRLYATTNGDVRTRPLDDYIAQSEQILNGDIAGQRFPPFICRLTIKKKPTAKTVAESKPLAAVSAHLMTEIEKEYRDWKR